MSSFTIGWTPRFIGADTVTFQSVGVEKRRETSQNPGVETSYSWD